MKLSEATLSTHQTIYIQTMKKSVYDNLRYATCHMYEVKSPAGITSHSIANADGQGYIIENDKEQALHQNIHWHKYIYLMQSKLYHRIHIQGP